MKAPAFSPVSQQSPNTLNSYVYDAAGVRVLKGQGGGQTVFVNGNISGSSGGVGARKYA